MGLAVRVDRFSAGVRSSIAVLLVVRVADRAAATASGHRVDLADRVDRDSAGRCIRRALRPVDLQERRDSVPVSVSVRAWEHARVSVSARAPAARQDFCPLAEAKRRVRNGPAQMPAADGSSIRRPKKAR